MIKAGIIGATGYAGNELVRILMGQKKWRLNGMDPAATQIKNMQKFTRICQIVDDVCLDDNMDELAYPVAPMIPAFIIFLILSAHAYLT